jgi:hypothetical protein
MKTIKCGMLAIVLMISALPSFANSINASTLAGRDFGSAMAPSVPGLSPSLALTVSNSITFSTFAFANNGFATVPLGPGLDPLLAPSVSGNGIDYLLFFTSFGPIGSWVFQSTLSLPGFQVTTGPYTGMCNAPNTCAVNAGGVVPAFYKPTPWNADSNAEWCDRNL